MKGPVAYDRGPTEPLRGRTVLITRPREQAGELESSFRKHGAEVVVLPLIRIVPPFDRSELLTAARRIAEYDWLVVTSANAVENFWNALDEVDADPGWVEEVSVCAIGPATARAVEQRGGRVRLVPKDFVAESLVEAMKAVGSLRGRRILFPKAEGAREVIPTSLRSEGAEVAEVVAYRGVADLSSADRLRGLLAEGAIDFITFTSSSAVRAFVDAAGSEIGTARIASIGPMTSGTLREYGMKVDVEAEPFTTEGLVDGIVRYHRRGEEEA